MMKLINDVVTQLGTSTVLKHADEDWGQLEIYPNPPVKFPCALVGINNGVFSNIGMDKTATPQNRQQGTILLNIRIANKRLTNSSSKAPASQRMNAQSVFVVMENVHELLQGWSPGDNVGKLIRERIISEVNDDGIQEYIVQYSVGISNC